MIDSSTETRVPGRLETTERSGPAGYLRFRAGERTDDSAEAAPLVHGVRYEPGPGVLLEESLDESRLRASARMFVQELFRAILSEAPRAEVDPVALDDGGLSIEFTAEGRELLVAIPPGGARCYMYARDQSDVARSGCLVDVYAGFALGRWLAGTGRHLPGYGIVFE